MQHQWRRFVAVSVFSFLFFFGFYFFSKQKPDKFYLPKYRSVHRTTPKEYGNTSSLPQVTDADDRLEINRYVAVYNSTVVGKEFNFDNGTLLIVRNLLKNQTFKRKPVMSIDAKTPFFDLVVPVTGCSSNHYGEFKGHIGHFAEQFPGIKVYFYDLGLADSEVSEILKTLPFVVYRKFNFDAYPPHVRNLHNYAWKTLIIQQMLSEFDGTMWFDSSLKFQEKNTSVIMEQLARHNLGFMFYVSTTGHSIITATHPGMMEYFPMEKTAAIKDMLQGGAVIVINKAEVQKFIMKWLVICVLKTDCIAPPGSTLYCGSNFPRERFGGCHRYDQSLVNILVSNTYNHSEESYHFVRSDTFALVNRG